MTGRGGLDQASVAGPSWNTSTVTSGSMWLSERKAVT
jgi:hypothetical protein